MSKARVMAIIWRHIYNFRHSWDRVSDAFYWPAVDILLWGLTSLYIRQASVGIPDIVVMLLTGLVFWQVVWRSQYEVSVNLLEEIWSRNLVNLFSTPLTVFEWIVAVVLLGFFKMLVTVGFAFLLVFLLYGVNVFQLGWMMIPFVSILLMSGWYIGFVVAGLIIRLGPRIQTLAWSGVYLFAPFSAIYYPIDVLPEWAQKISGFIPTSYVFEGMRSVLFEGIVDVGLIVKSGVMSIGYLVVAVLFFLVMYNSSRKSGLIGLE